MGSRGMLERLVKVVREHLPDGDCPVLDSKEGIAAISKAAGATSTYKAKKQEPASAHVDVQLRVEALLCLARAMRAQLPEWDWAYCHNLLQATTKIATMAPREELGGSQPTNHFGKGFMATTTTVTLRGFNMGPGGVPERQLGKLGLELRGAIGDCFSRIHAQLQQASYALHMPAWDALASCTHLMLILEYFFSLGNPKKTARSQAAAQKRAELIATALCDGAKLAVAAAPADLAPHLKQAREYLDKAGAVPVALFPCESGKAGMHVLLDKVNALLATELGPEALQRAPKNPLLPQIMDLLSKTSLLAGDADCAPPEDALTASRAAWRRIRAACLPLPKNLLERMGDIITPRKASEAGSGSGLGGMLGRQGASGGKPDVDDMLKQALLTMLLERSGYGR